jgi:hypothetical protein
MKQFGRSSNCFIVSCFLEAEKLPKFAQTSVEEFKKFIKALEEKAFKNLEEKCIS